MTPAVTYGDPRNLVSSTLRHLALDAFAFAFIVISQHGESLIYLKYTPIVLPSVTPGESPPFLVSEGDI